MCFATQRITEPPSWRSLLGGVTDFFSVLAWTGREKTGNVAVPLSGDGKKEGSSQSRIKVLPPADSCTAEVAMSALTSLFNRGILGTRCKTCLNLAISRIKLLRNKREVQLKQMRTEISQYLQSGQEAIARIRVEHIIREDNISAAYEILELFCEFILARIPILETQRKLLLAIHFSTFYLCNRDCPLELQEAIASVIYAAPRCSDLPELMQVKNLFTTKYGKEFIAAASELRPDSNVNRMIIEKLSVKAPPAEAKLGVLKGIAQEFNLEWDSTGTEIEFSKKHEDLLGGLSSGVATPADPVLQSTSVSSHKNVQVVLPSNQNQGMQLRPTAPTVVEHVPSVSNKDASMGTEKMELPIENQNGRLQSSPDVLERARAAIASAERASAAARAAANLVNSRVNRQADSGKHPR
ncbi:hypothetical protein Taro_032362 [Colocasia esculenta]|uniref:IST1 homolog n=1 Tax=Colocasia esculenta TaxID=4460 RepID=A0A843VR72_COLES|nr:hypothetical protein [Colocasia esculenta]